MRTLGLLVAVAAVALWAQDAAQEGAAKGKSKAPANAKGAPAKGKGKAAAESKPPAPPAVHQVLRLLRPSMYLVTGHGANAIFRVTPEGVILVNTKQDDARDYTRLVELIRGITPSPVKLILNSSARPDASGNNTRFAAAGAQVDAGARTERLGGVEVRTLVFGEHTAIYFPADKMVYLGELFPAGPVDALEATLKLDWTLAVPATGEPIYRAAVEARVAQK